MEFRAYHKKLKKMFYFSFDTLVGGDDGTVSIDGTMFGVDITDESLVFMQYMGYKDKTGKKIYKNDFVKNDGEIYLIGNLEDIFCANSPTNDAFSCDELYEGGNLDCEVVGNNLKWIK